MRDGSETILSAAEIDAVTTYSGSDYTTINKCLRDEGPCSAETLRIVQIIDGAIAKSTVPRDMILYRGMGVDAANRLRVSGLAIGSYLDDHAFMSTSTDPDEAEMFAAFPPGGLMFRIHIPAGAPALDMAPYSLYPDECEVLLPRGTRLRILGYDATKSELECEVVS